MTVKIEFGDEIQAAIQEHLDGNLESVQEYIRAAVRFFRDLRTVEQQGSRVGYGSADRFKTYNTEVSPAKYLGFENPKARPDDDVPF